MTNRRIPDFAARPIARTAGEIADLMTAVDPVVLNLQERAMADDVDYLRVAPLCAIAATLMWLSSDQKGTDSLRGFLEVYGIHLDAFGLPIIQPLEDN